MMERKRKKNVELYSAFVELRRNGELSTLVDDLYFVLPCTATVLKFLIEIAFVDRQPRLAELVASNLMKS